MIKKFKEVCLKAISGGTENASSLALTMAWGLYIAFSPFPGLHSVMILSVKWWLGLNLPMLFIFASINNPWTMIPFYSLDYVFGYWLLHNFLGFNNLWNISLDKIWGPSKICVWSFFVGGNVIGIVVAILSYPISKYVFSKIYKSKQA